MKTSGAGKSLIKKFEGVYRRPYLCPAYIWTVGVGHVLYPDQIKLKVPDRKTYPLQPEHDRDWSHEAIDFLLDSDLLMAESAVLRLCPNSAFSQCHFDALVAFVFNVGSGALQASTLRRKFNQGDLVAAGDEFLKWNKAGGRALAGLTRRRLAEKELFLSK